MFPSTGPLRLLQSRQVCTGLPPGATAPPLQSTSVVSGRNKSKKPLVRIPSITEGVSNGPRSVLYPGDELSGKDNFLRSPNGRYEAVFTSEGPVEVYLTDGKEVGDRSVIIHSRRLRSGHQNETLVTWRMTEHGHLVATCADGSIYFSTEGQALSQVSSCFASLLANAKLVGPSAFRLIPNQAFGG